MPVYINNQNLVTNGLILYLDANNPVSYSTGTAWNDLSGNNNSAILDNSITYTYNNFGTLNYDGVTSYARISSLENTNFPQSQGTIAFWCYINDTYGNQYTLDTGIFDSYYTASDHFFIKNNYSSLGNLQFAAQGASDSYYYFYNTSVANNMWHYITLTYITGVTNSVNVYIDGALMNTGTLSTTTWTPSGQKVGFLSSTSTSSVATCMPGNYAGLKIYNRSLTASEVTQNYNFFKLRFRDSNENIWTTYKKKVSSIYDAVVNPDGELIWNTLPSDMKSSLSLQIMPYAMSNGQIIAGDNLGNTVSVSHSRGSLATFVDKDGYIKYGAHNLFNYSELFSNAYWTKQAATVSYGVITAPDGTLTGTKLIATGTTTSNTHSLIVGPTMIPGISYNVSIYAKAAEYTRIEQSPNGPYSFCIYDLVNKTATIASGFVGCSIQDVGNGWFRCSATYIAVASVSYPIWFMNNTPSGVAAHTFTADGVSGIYIWGNQLRALPSPSNYVKTTGAAAYLPRWTYDPYTADYLGWLLEISGSTNLVLYSNNFTQSAWNTGTVIAISASAANITSPDGLINSYIITSTTASAVPRWRQNVTGLITSTTYTLSTWVKQGNTRYTHVQLTNVGETQSALPVFDFIGETFSMAYSSFGSISYNFERYRDGWYKLNISFGLTGGTTAIEVQPAMPCRANNSVNVVANDYVYVYGFQLEAGDKPSSYIPTYASQVTRSPDNTSFTSSYTPITTGMVYADAALYRYNNSGSVAIVIRSGSSAYYLYSNSDTLVHIYDSTGAASKIITDVKLMQKHISSWGNLGLRITSNGLSIGTFSFDGSMGTDGTKINIGNSSALQIYLRSLVLFSQEFDSTSMQNWTNNSYFSYETPYKKFKSFTSSNIYFIPEGDSQYQRLPDFIRNTSNSLLVSGAFSGNTIYGLDNTGNLVNFNHTRGSLATQVNRNVLTEFCAHNLIYASEDITSTSRLIVSTMSSFSIGATVSSTNGSIGNIIYLDTLSIGVYSTFSSFTGTLTQTIPIAASASLSGSNGLWQQNNIIVTNNATASSNGVLKADLIKATGIGTHAPLQTLTLQKNRIINISCLFKAAGSSRLNLNGNAYTSNSFGVLFNVSSGTPVLTTALSGNGVVVTYSCISEGNGWWRASAVGIPSQYDSNSGVDANFFICNSAGNTSYTAGTESMYITETSVSYYPTQNVYIPTLSSLIYAPRYTYNPTTLSYEGWLFEGASTNYLINSSMIGASMSGLTGSNPTSWSLGDSKGLTKIISSIGIDNNLPYINIRYVGTCSSSGAIEVYPQGVTLISATQGQSWTTSWFLKSVNSYPNSAELSILEWAPSVVYLTEGAKTVTLSSNLTRYTHTRVLTSASVSNVSCSLRFNVTNTLSYDFTVRVAGPQLELSATVSSYIPTYGSQTTRNADTFAASASNNMLNLGSLYMNMRTTKITATNSVHVFTDLGNQAIPFWTNAVNTKVQSQNYLGSNSYITTATNTNSFAYGSFNKLAVTWGNNLWQTAGISVTGSESAFTGPFGTGILSIPIFNVANNLQAVNILTIANIPQKLNILQIKNITT